MRWWARFGLVAMLTGCSTGANSSGPVSSDQTGELSPELAPSQVSASTVPRPATPDPCRVDDLAIWTAQIESGSVVIRIRNDGSAWCDVDITDSAQLDPLAEPAIWLEPGDGANLVAGESEPGCEAPRPFRTIEFDMGGTSVSVPSALVACGWWLTALYPVDGAAASCSPDQLDAVWVDADDLLLVRNSGFDSCTLAIGEGDARSGDVVDIDELAAGDLAAWRSVGEQCGDGPTLPFRQPSLVVAGLPECPTFVGPGAPVDALAPHVAVALGDGSLDLFGSTQ